MDIRKMKYFITVAEELNFSRAAERLMMAQPPLSQEIRKLEEELGVQLFHRTKRMVELTEVGKVFLEGARQTLLQVDRTIKETQLADEGKIGHLIIGFVDSTETVIGILKTFRERFPKIQLILREMTTDQQIKALYEKQIHIGFIRSEQNNEILSSEVCSEECLKLVLHENHPFVSLPNISIKSLVEEPFILFPRHFGTNFYDLIISYFWKYGVSLNIVQEAVQMQTIVNLVAAGMGISVVPSSVESYKKSGVMYKDILENTPEINLYAGWRKDEKSVVLKNFLTVVREVYMTSHSPSL
ncbi:LysR substrate-binding domain-containing protein [Bacillus thuringiensis]|uniref:LysR substrate-binding domain-containing protein n=1 Tax=Bacillus thuringiensis TaxID=1428 RepID=UPI0007C18774|nr:LysR substrate-binding domain-containing protein [Bacillus thuringiensis]AND08064.1 LysR family transcriptional regulator [Bacillus thuringiensis serovar alesti]MEC3598228.1 LysR substrate-binding domain-containing protein [Bacillus thuringiensis]MED1833103.1 LysR substrate-binding domain-containing protein [Bacillus thuringiensis]MED2211011.1 LysR substrate-binding domain-containing protein [Bacillus thuringiensis]MED2666776.1 LysR substrate-binding domain-containing protein [Bacillus thur